MKKFDYEKIKENNDKLNMIRQLPDVQVSGDEMSIQDAIEIANAMLSKYIKVLVDKPKSDLDEINHWIWLRNSGNYRPKIEGIYPTIDENGHNFIRIVFSDEKTNEIVGYATYDAILGVRIEQLAEQYNELFTKNIFLEFEQEFLCYSFALEAFKNEFPGVSVEFNEKSTSPNSSQVIDTGFIRFFINYANLLKPSVELSKEEDRKQLSIGFYNPTLFTKKIAININDLNPLLREAINKFIRETESILAMEG